MPITALTDAEIIARCQSGELLDDIGRREADIADPASLLNRCIALHNARQIDLLSLWRGLIHSVDQHFSNDRTFSTGRSLYLKQLPLR